MMSWMKSSLGLGESHPPAGEGGIGSVSGTLTTSQRDNSSKSVVPEGIIELIQGSVYLLSEPENRAPNVDVVFIHGLQVEDYKDAYWKTWTVGNNDKECWPMKFLKADFPNARILSVTYDSSALVTSKTGRMDIYAAGETLVSELVEGPVNVGQNGCPIVFVCHSLGGLVAKQIVLHANGELHRDDPKYKNFLGNIRGFHYYSTPHLGSHLADLALSLPYWKKRSKMVLGLQVINDELGRLNGRFRTLANGEYSDRWVSAAVGEKNETRLYGFSKLVVVEASARDGTKYFKLVDADHFGVCKPESTTSSSYISLKNFIHGVVPTTLVSDEDNLM